MRHNYEDYCAGTIEHIRNRTTCDWCLHPKMPVMQRTKLCRHCNRIRLGFNALSERNRKFEEKHGGLTFTMRWELEVQQAMMESAQGEGRVYGRFYDDDMNDVRLEHEWRITSSRCVGKDLFYGIVDALNLSLDVNQRRYIFYLLSLINREWMRKNRRSLAYGMVQQATLDRPPGPKPIVVGRIDRLTGKVVPEPLAEVQPPFNEDKSQ
jgi:hypothetical protein